MAPIIFFFNQPYLEKRFAGNSDVPDVDRALSGRCERVLVRGGPPAAVDGPLQIFQSHDAAAVAQIQHRNSSLGCGN